MILWLGVVVLQYQANLRSAGDWLPFVQYTRAKIT